MPSRRSCRPRRLWFLRRRLASCSAPPLRRPEVGVGPGLDRVRLRPFVGARSRDWWRGRAGGGAVGARRRRENASARPRGMRECKAWGRCRARSRASEAAPWPRPGDGDRRALQPAIRRSGRAAGGRAADRRPRHPHPGSGARHMGRWWPAVLGEQARAAPRGRRARVPAHRRTRRVRRRFVRHAGRARLGRCRE